MKIIPINIARIKNNSIASEMGKNISNSRGQLIFSVISLYPGG
jgi:hypothetical protein